jgi:hypothetical protein
MRYWVMEMRKFKFWLSAVLEIFGSPVSTGILEKHTPCIIAFRPEHVGSVSLRNLVNNM